MINGNLVQKYLLDAIEFGVIKHFRGFKPITKMTFELKHELFNSLQSNN